MLENMGFEVDFSAFEACQSSVHLLFQASTCCLCPLRNQCLTELQRVLDPALFSGLLDHAYDKCYGPACEDILRIDGRSRPSKCVRFGVRTEPSRALARNIFGWHKVYHGTKKEFVSSIVKLGYLLKCGDQTEEGQIIGSRDVEKIACMDGTFRTKVKIRQGRAIDVETEMDFVPKQFVFSSPSFLYACNDAYAETFDAGFKIVLEFRLKQESFLPGPQTLRVRVQDSKVPEDRFEYFTARHGVMALTGIIVKPPAPQPCLCPAWSLSVPRIPTASEFKLSCPNALRRWHVLMSLGISPLFFNHAFDRCYCGCQMLPDFVVEGGRKYVLPKPGTRFALHLDEARDKALGYFQGWHTCFHGTRLGSVLPVVECGYLLYPGCITVYGDEIKGREHRGDYSRTPAAFGDPDDTICVSPSVSYASHPVYASPTRLGGHEYRVALQFKIRPDSYEVRPSTIRYLPSGFDPYVKLGEMEWHTRRHGTLVLYGIVILDGSAAG